MDRVGPTTSAPYHVRGAEPGLPDHTPGCQVSAAPPPRVEPEAAKPPAKTKLLDIPDHGARGVKRVGAQTTAGALAGGDVGVIGAAMLNRRRIDAVEIQAISPGPPQLGIDGPNAHALA